MNWKLTALDKAHRVGLVELTRDLDTMFIMESFFLLQPACDISHLVTKNVDIGAKCLFNGIKHFPGNLAL